MKIRLHMLVILIVSLSSCEHDTPVFLCPGGFYAGDTIGGTYVVLDSAFVIPIQSDSGTYSDCATFFLDLDDDGIHDLRFTKCQDFPSWDSPYFTYVYSGVSELHDSVEIGFDDEYPAMLAEGSDMLADSLWTGSLSGGFLHLLDKWPFWNEVGNWTGDGYMPVRIRNGDLTYYWIRMNVYAWDKMILFEHASQCLN